MSPNKPQNKVRANVTSLDEIKLIDAVTPTEVVVTDPELRELSCVLDNFPQVYNVTRLKFNGNKIEHLPNTFSTLEHLQYLEVSSNRLSSIPEEIGHLGNLISLNLSENAFDTLPTAILSLAKLQVLDISNNEIKVVPERMGNLMNLHRLNVSCNKLEDLPDTLCQLKHLTDLNISQNQLSSLPDCFYLGLKNIIKLDLSNNRMNDLSAPPLCANQLQKLNLSYNFLPAIPEWTYVTCGSLVDLNLSNNSELLGRSLEDTQNVYFGVGGMRSTLKRINLSGCGLKSQSFEFLTRFRNLVVVRAGNDYLLDDGKSIHKYVMNNIWDLPLNVLTCISNLCELHVPAVGLTTLPDNIFELKHLRVIDLRSNELHFLNAAFCQMRSLTKVMLSNNRLVALPLQFGDLKNLKELKVDSNQLSSLPESFSKLSHLIYLDLYDNYLEENISEYILTSPRLKGFDIEGNICDTTKMECFTPYDDLKTALRIYCGEKARVDGAKPLGSGDVPDIVLTEETDYHLKYESDFSESDGKSDSERSPVPDGINDAEKWSSNDEGWDLAIEDESDWTPPAVSQVSAACKVAVAASRYPLPITPRKIFVKLNLVTNAGQFDEPAC